MSSATARTSSGIKTLRVDAGSSRREKDDVPGLEYVFDNIMYSRKGMGSAMDKGDFDDESLEDGIDEDGKKRKRGRGQLRSMTEEQKIERRERNREHAKRSRVRKKFLLESLQHSVSALRGENDKLRSSIREHLKDEADELLNSCKVSCSGLVANEDAAPTKGLESSDHSLVKALQMAQQNFVITDPTLPDNPIVYASQGFLSLTGYALDQVLGRNCRFLQGPETDARSVQTMRKGIEAGVDTTTVLMNYRLDGSSFYNQCFVAALRDGEGNVVNYLGVQCKVTEEYARAYLKNGGEISASS